MYKINKSSKVTKEISQVDMDKINTFSRRPLTEEDVYTIPIRACDDLPDRDCERFTADCLSGLAGLFVGKTVIFDHEWSAKKQTGRIYAAEVLSDNDSTYLHLQAYMLRNESTQGIIDALDAGILKEVSVGCAVASAKCSICGQDYGSCGHRRGNVYDGKQCIVELSEPTDAYEVSFVAVPAQPKAGVTKAAGDRCMDINDVDRAKARVCVEKIRFGG